MSVLEVIKNQITKRKNIVVFLGLLILNFLIYSKVLGSFFISDDFDWLNIVSSSKTVLLSFVGNYYGAHGVGGSFRPLVAVFFYLSRLVFGLNPFGYHFVQILFHAVSAFLIWLIVGKLGIFDRLNKKVAGLSAILFSILPNHVEAVAWVSAIGDPMATAFYLASFYFYIRHRSGYRNYIISLGFFTLALLTKEIAITLPLILLGYELLILKNNSIKLFFKKTAPFFALVVAYLTYRFWAIGLFFGYYARSSLFNLVKIKDYIKTLINLFSSMFAVGQFRIDLVSLIIRFRFLFLLVIILLAGLIIFKTKQKEKHWFGFWTLFWLINVAIILPLNLGILNDEGQRFGYLASVSFAIMLASDLVYLGNRFKKSANILLGLIVCYSLFFQQILINQWKVSSILSRQIFDQLKTFDFASPTKTYVIGLPDSYLNAQLYRNGFVQSLALQNIAVDSKKIERIPVYVYLNSQNHDQKLYEKIDVWSNGLLWQIKNQAAIVTGNATNKTSDYIFELWDYNYANATSDKIRLIFQGSTLDDFKQQKIQILYYDQGQLKSLPL